MWEKKNPPSLHFVATIRGLGVGKGEKHSKWAWQKTNCSGNYSNKTLNWIKQLKQLFMEHFFEAIIHVVSIEDLLKHSMPSLLLSM